MEGKHRRAVITGVGLVTPFGFGVSPYWQAISEGRSAVANVSHFDPRGLPCTFGGYLQGDTVPMQLADPGGTGAEPRFVQFALAASETASKESAWADSTDPERVGVFLGTSGERPSLSRFANVVYQARDEEGEISLPGYVRVWQATMKGAIQRLLPQYATAQVARRLGICGPVTTFNTACTSSAHAIGEARNAVRRGVVDVALAGGSECLVSQIGFHIFSPLGVLSRRNDAPEKASRPFDAGRDGFVLGEGAGILVIEELQSAIKRKAPILAELAGYGTSCDAYRITDEAPDGRGAIGAMRKAMENAAVSTDEVDYINAHGTSTVMNDRIETRAIKEVFGRRAYEIPVSSTKSMIGHTISAAGAIEAITCVLTLQNQTITPTINYEAADPDCDLDYVPNNSRRAAVRVTLSNSFGFGGHNDCLVIRTFQA